jgi:bifunctional DNA-binding transcriptional regulator/antitoxin component of YhaV-PrlF toxin-antitoxin module
MRLQKHLVSKIGGKEYYKHVVVIPPEHIEKLGWEAGQELEPTVRGNKLVLSPQQDADD